MRRLRHLVWLLFLLSAAHAAPKPHVIVFGKWQAVKLPVQPDDKRVQDVKVRALLVDGRLKEYTVGIPHEVTDHIFVVQRATRLNDSLPEEAGSPPRWNWQRGGWLLVDRATGRLTLLNLAAFDSFLSSVSWYRDYAAYCGLSDDGTKMYAVVAQLGRRKPLLHKPLESGSDNEGCGTPIWQRDPMRVTFVLSNSQRLTFSVRARTEDLTIGSEDAEDAE